MVQTMAHISKEARYFLGRAMEATTRSNPEQVIAYFDRAIEMDPGFAMAWNEKGNYLDLIGKFDEALSCYDSALTIEPDDAEIWFNKGLTLKKVGREKEAAGRTGEPSGFFWFYYRRKQRGGGNN